MATRRKKKTPHVANLKVGKRYIFRVHRFTDPDKPPVLLEPLTDDMTMNLQEGNEFITGTLASDPFKSSQWTAVKDDPIETIDGSRRLT